MVGRTATILSSCKMQGERVLFANNSASGTEVGKFADGVVVTNVTQYLAALSA